MARQVKRMVTQVVYHFELFNNAVNEIDDILDIPNGGRDASGYGRSNAQRLVNAAEVVIHKVKRNGTLMVFHLL